MITILVLIAIGYLTLYFVSHPVRSVTFVAKALGLFVLGIITCAALIMGAGMLLASLN